jgi:hypothetical protein
VIFPFNDKTRKFVAAFLDASRSAQLHRQDGKPLIDVLFDDSCGMGKLSAKYRPPVFPGLIHGHAGGLSPENIQAELTKMSVAQADTDAVIWIDAESSLRGDFLGRAEKLYKNAMAWERS